MDEEDAVSFPREPNESKDVVPLLLSVTYYGTPRNIGGRVLSKQELIGHIMSVEQPQVDKTVLVPEIVWD